MSTIADQLASVWQEFPLDGQGRERMLRAKKVRFVKDGMLHQIANYDRRSGSWISACGVSYEGDGYAESSTPGQLDCMVCLSDADDLSG